MVNNGGHGLVGQPKSNLPLERRACTGWFKPPPSSPSRPPPPPLPPTTQPLDRGWFCSERRVKSETYFYCSCRWISATGHFSVRRLTWPHTCGPGPSRLLFSLPENALYDLDGFFARKIARKQIIKINQITQEVTWVWMIFPFIFIVDQNTFLH